MLQIPATNLAPLRLADSAQAKPGEHVVAIGNPLGLGGLSQPVSRAAAHRPHHLAHRRDPARRAAFRPGNAEACYRIHESAALDVPRTTAQCPGPKQALSDGLSAAETMSKWTDKSRVVREQIDGILVAIPKSVVVQKDGSIIQRHIPG